MGILGLFSELNKQGSKEISNDHSDETSSVMKFVYIIAKMKSTANKNISFLENID